jgi:hypothetical protein
LSFISKGAYIGAIYPLKLPKGFSSQNTLINTLFNDNFDERDEVLLLKKNIFEPDSDKVSSKVFKTNFIIKYLRLKSGKEIRDTKMDTYFFVYDDNFGSFVYWLDFKHYELEYEEIVELGALAKGTFVRFEKLSFTITLDGKTFEASSFHDICHLLEKKIFQIFQKDNHSKRIPSFSYPAIYLIELPDCNTSDDIIRKYPKEIKGITNLWLSFEMDMLKEKDVFKTLHTDYHPFNYGVSVASKVCSLEVHGNSINEATANYKMDFFQMHFEERFDWIFQCELPIMHYYILRRFDSLLSNTPNNLPSIYSIIKKPFLIFQLFGQLIFLSNIYRKVIHSLNEFRQIYLTRREYSNEALNIYFDIFHIDLLNHELDKKLVNLQNEINLSYSMLTTLFFFFLTILGTIFAFFEAYSALIGLNWI